MSDLDIKDFLEAGRTSLKAKNYWSALSVALTLPSMCSRLAFSKTDAQYYDNRTNQWKDKKCYVDFCTKVLATDGWFKSCFGKNCAENLYSLRCDVLHAGEASVNIAGTPLCLMLGEWKTSIVGSSPIIVPIKALCETIFDSINMWLWNFEYKGNNLPSTKVFDIDNNKSDREEFQRVWNGETI